VTKTEAAEKQIALDNIIIYL